MDKLSERMAWAIENCVDSWSELEEEAIKEGIDRLAYYEDTGLEPEQVKDMAENAETRLLTWFEAKYGFPVGKLMDFCEAEQQGRLVVLPCKVGDTVYKICPVSNFLEFGDRWDGRLVQTDCDRCAYYACDCHNIGYQKDARNVIVKRKMGDLTSIVRCIPYFGKIYFLSREEALKALRKEYISEDIQRQKYISEDIEKDGENNG